jgi:putative transcriptional regulator
MSTTLYVANRVREIRKKLGLRQEDLAREVGVSRQTIIALERGREVNPSIQTCLLIARVLREPADFLFYLVPAREDIAAAEPAAVASEAVEETPEQVPNPPGSEEPFQVLPPGLTPASSDGPVEETAAAPVFDAVSEPDTAESLETDPEAEPVRQSVWDFQ